MAGELGIVPIRKEKRMRRFLSTLGIVVGLLIGLVAPPAGCEEKTHEHKSFWQQQKHEGEKSKSGDEGEKKEAKDNEKPTKGETKEKTSKNKKALDALQKGVSQ